LKTNNFALPFSEFWTVSPFISVLWFSFLDNIFNTKREETYNTRLNAETVQKSENGSLFSLKNKGLVFRKMEANRKDKQMTDKFTHPNDAEEGHQWVFDGKLARGVMHLGNVTDGYPIVAAVAGTVETFTREGYYCENGDGSRLVDAPRAHVEWQNHNRRGQGLPHRVWVYDSKEDADAAAGPDRIACVKVKWKDGQFDE
jgi:hypothetical protein